MLFMMVEEARGNEQDEFVETIKVLSQVFIIFLGRNNSFLGGLRLIEC
jgi:hypothetical protein